MSATLRNIMSEISPATSSLAFTMSGAFSMTYFSRHRVLKDLTTSMLVTINLWITDDVVGRALPPL